MSDTPNPAWELCREIVRSMADLGAEEAPLLRILHTWVQDVERRLPATPSRPAPREAPGEAMAAAVERIGDLGPWPSEQAERCAFDDDRPCSCESAVHCPARPPAAPVDRAGGSLEAQHARQLADALSAPGAEAYSEREHCPELCSCGHGRIRPTGPWRSCVACGKSWRVPSRVRPEARPQSTWIVSEGPASHVEAPGPIEAIRELLDAAAAEESGGARGPGPGIVLAARRLLMALRAAPAHRLVGFPPSKVLP